MPPCTHDRWAVDEKSGHWRRPKHGTAESDFWAWYARCVQCGLQEVVWNPKPGEPRDLARTGKDPTYRAVSGGGA